jgi:hypothetical protein
MYKCFILSDKSQVFEDKYIGIIVIDERGSNIYYRHTSILENSIKNKGITMKKKCATASIFFIACAAFTSCLTEEQVRNWLNAKKCNPSINITGEWNARSVFGGWGGSKFVQTGNEIIGTIGLY